jgi:Haem-binding domain
LCAGGFAGLLTLCSVAVHPSGPVKQSDWQAVPARDLHVPPELAPLLKRSCMDCHSNRTSWPWYSYVAPVSWLVERDVRRGRQHMNLSEWDQYTFKQREKLLAGIATAVKNREMPLPQYTLLHRDARLSDAETDRLYAWARVERRRLKTMLPVVPASAGQSAGSQ